jgi:hypothetical protein
MNRTSDATCINCGDVGAIACFGNLAFIPFGFDHPSSWGLDFDHLVKLVTVYCVALLAGIIAAAAQRQYLLILVQFTFPVAFIGSLALAGMLKNV